MKYDVKHRSFTSANATYWLDTASGGLHYRRDGRSEKGRNYRPVSAGRWRNEYGEVYAVSSPCAVGADGGMKFDAGKPRWSLLMRGFAQSLAALVRVLTFGANKYAAHSWRTVPNGEERYRDALYRHLAAIEAGEKCDPESGESHYAHAAFNILALHELELQNDQAK